VSKEATTKIIDALAGKTHEGANAFAPAKPSATPQPASAVPAPTKTPAPEKPHP